MGETEKAEQALSSIVKMQSENGSFPQAKTSITRSSGKPLIVETTSLALLAMMKVDESKYAGEIKKGLDFLMGAMNGGYFGSTQATILAMKAIVEFMKNSAAPSDESLFEVFLNDTPYLMTLGDSMGGKKSRAFKPQIIPKI